MKNYSGGTGMMSRAQNIYQFRRVNMHGTKSGPHADPDYHQKYHPTDGRSRGFGLSDGKHKIKIKADTKGYDPYLTFEGPDFWLDVYVNPTRQQLKRLADPDDPFAVEMRFMVHRETGDLIAWESDKAFHTQVTHALMEMPAWAAQNNDVVDLYSDFIIPADTFYEGLEHWIGEGHGKEIFYYFDFEDGEVIVPKILRGK